MAEPLMLAGCAPEPLMSYLKTLGVFRLVAEQADANVRLSWMGGVAHQHSNLDRNGLITFFLDRYRPTPILAPWNGGSGFYGSGSEALKAITESKGDRLALYRDTISCIGKYNFIPKEKPKDEGKKALLIRCRAELPDEVVPWLDACFALGEERVSFFPLLGTGGNDGRLDFTNNFMQRLADIIPFGAESEPTHESREYLSASLFSDWMVSLKEAAIGQFNPGGIGGANGTQKGFVAHSQMNPWDFVLMIEGALLFAGSVARRFSANSASRSVFPFCVESVAVGYGSATANEETAEGSRAELWLPLWAEPMTYAETKHLFAEGRAQLGRRQARNAVEFALAVNLLGINRGIQSFTRYGFLKRNGLAFLATPLGRVEVTARPEARLLDDPPLTEWLDRLRSACRDKEKTPARYQTALRNIDRATFAFANRSEQGNDAKYLLSVLCTVGSAERTLANGLSFCKDKHIRPLSGLNPGWLEQADDNSPEFRLAASLAGIRVHGYVGSLRVFLEEVEEIRFVRWLPGSTSAVWSKQSLAANLAAVFRRRMMEAFRDSQTWEKVGVPLYSPRPAQLGDVMSYLDEEIDEIKLTDLLWGLSAVDWSIVDFRLPEANEVALPFEFGVLRLLVEPAAINLDMNAATPRWRLVAAWDGEETNAKPDPDVFQALASGRSNAVGEGVDHAARRLKSGGRLVVGYRNRTQTGKSLQIVSPIPADRLLAAMLIPLCQRDLNIVVNAVLYPPEIEE